MIEKARQELYKAQDRYDKSKREVERVNSGYAQKEFGFATQALQKAEQKIEGLKKS